MGNLLTEKPPDDMELHEEGLFKVPGLNFPINLITPEQLKELPDGTQLYSIRGKTLVVGHTKIPLDVKGGFLAIGFKRDDAIVVPRFLEKPSQYVKKFVKKMTGKNLVSRGRSF